MQHLKGFQYANTLDLRMGYYNIRILPASQDMPPIVHKFGKFWYNYLPTGMCALVDISQAKVDDLLGDIKGIKTYIDNIIILGKDWFTKRMEQLMIIFGGLLAAGLKMNTPVCSFGLKEIPYLGYIITREGIKTDPKKLKGTMDIGWPSNTTKVRAIIVMVQYYRNMWPRWSHLLSTLIEAARGPQGRTIFWNDALESSFKELNCMISDDTLLSYPDWTIPFTVHTDDSDKQLGAVISLNKESIALFSRILIKPQRNHTTTEKEIIAIVECLKQLRDIIFGYKIHVFSDHKNMVYAATWVNLKRWWAGN